MILRRRVTDSDFDAAFIKLIRKGRRSVDWRMLYREIFGVYPDGADRQFIARVRRWATKRGLAAERRYGRRYFYR